MKDLHLQFRPVAEFLLDFIRKSPVSDLCFVRNDGDFKVYAYTDKFILRRLLYTLYRVDFVDVDIYVNFNSSCIELHLCFDVYTVFPSVRVECTIYGCGEFNLKYYYIGDIEK